MTDCSASPPEGPYPTIGVFDSGFGGLTVLRALLKLLPGARFVYLGDTARLPYGDKSQTTVARYALSSAAFLLAEGIDLLVVACNTASALALPELSAALPIPVVGVIEPGVAAARTLGDGEVLVLATAATVHSHAYARACRGARLAASEKACPLLVPLVEEGWIDHPVTREVVRIYLAEALADAPRATTLVLGCTHYPLLQPVFREVLDTIGHPLAIVNSAQATAEAALRLLPARSSPPGHAVGPSPPSTWTPSAALAAGFFTQMAHLPPQAEALRPEPASAITFYATDSVEKFARLGPHFLGQPIAEVHLVDLGG